MVDCKVGLALGGGAARGWAHIGVIKALTDAGIVPDIIAGTSIGAVVGGSFAARQLPDLEAFALSLTRRRVFGFLDINFSGSGLISGQKLCDRLESHLTDTTIEGLERRFVAVATELGTGQEVWLSRGRLVDAMRASYALPGIFKPVSVSGRWLFDGALVNPVPVSVCRALGARYVIAVHLNSDVCGPGRAIADAFPDLTEEASGAASEPATPPKGKNGHAARRMLQRQLLGRSDEAPGISAVMMDAFNIVQDRIARSRLAGDPPDCLITPRLSGIGLFEFHRAKELIDRGANAASRELEDIGREIRARKRVARVLGHAHH